MLDRLTGKPVHLYIHLFSCALIAAGLPTSKVPLSLGTMLCLLNLFLEADFRTYKHRLKNNRVAFGLWIYIGIQLLSLFWTSDWNYATHDLRVKLPLLIIPVALVCKPVSERRHLVLLLGLFLTALFVTSFINIGSYRHWWGAKIYDDVRGMSLFGSHIRYALMIVMGIVVCIEWIRQKLKLRWVAVVLIGWFISYTNFSQILSGYLALGMVAIVSLVLVIIKIRTKRIRLAVIFTSVALAAGLTAALIDFMQPVPHKVSLRNLPQRTVNGNPYHYDTYDPIWENGYPVVAFICEKELSKAWNSASSRDYYTGLDNKKQPVFLTLWFYMTSKGLHKDSVGFLSMTAADISNVERGYASVNMTRGAFYARLLSLKHQLEHPENPNGHSLLQRLEYWKAGMHIIRGNWAAGVGYGDVQQAFDSYYTASHSPLDEDLRLHCHNQYLTSWITAGIFGLFSFLLWWLGFFRYAWKNKQYAAICFATIAMSSFLIEDTIETQMGVTFVAFFYRLFAGRARQSIAGADNAEM